MQILTSFVTLILLESKSKVLQRC